MNCTIIVFPQSSKELLNHIKEWKNSRDKFVLIRQGSGIRKFNNAVQNSGFRNIIIFNPEFSFFDQNYVELFKKYFSEEIVSVYTDKFRDGSIVLPSKNTAISFSKVNFRPITKNYFAPISLQRHILSTYSKVYVLSEVEEEEIDEEKVIKDFGEKVDRSKVSQVPRKKVEEPKKVKEIYPEIKKVPKEREEDLSSIEKAQKISTKSKIQKRTRPDRNSKKERQFPSKKRRRKEDAKEKSVNPSPLYNPKSGRKPKILLVCDVKGGAGGIKSLYLKQHLSEYYDFDLINLIGPDKKKIKTDDYDLYFTFGYSYVGYIKNFPQRKRVTGVTAHRPLHLLKNRMHIAYATHANSILLFNELKQMHNNPFYVPNGVDETLFFEKNPVLSEHDEPIIGHVGKKGRMKNQHAIIEPAIKKVNAKYHPHYNDYTNKVPHKQMVDIHNKYDIFIAASDEDGTPNGMLEAAACGRPIIINKIGNAPEFVKNGYNGFIVEKKVDAYAEAIRGFQKNPDKVYEMGQNARREIEEAWTGELMCKNYKYMFDSILGIERDKSEYENPARYHV